MQSIRDYTESYHELSPPVERHGRTFPPSIERRHYGARVTEPVDYYFTCCTFRSSAVKERLGRSAAEMIYGTTLRLPGEFTKQYTVDANTDL